MDTTWESERRHLIVKYLEGGSQIGDFLGYSYCRFGCTKQYKTEYLDEEGQVWHRPETYPLMNGKAIFGDDVWCWPEGLAHYVKHHHIRLPSEFVAHLAAREFEPFGNADIGPVECNEEFWVEWSAQNAPFEYEARCYACTRL